MTDKEFSNRSIDNNFELSAPFGSDSEHGVVQQILSPELEGNEIVVKTIYDDFGTAENILDLRRSNYTKRVFPELEAARLIEEKVEEDSSARPNILYPFAYNLSPDRLEMYMRKMDGDMRSFASKDRIPSETMPLDAEDFYNYIIQIGKAIDFLASLNISHRDVKLENIFYQTDNEGNSNFYLGDLGYVDLKNHDPFLDRRSFAKLLRETLLPDIRSTDETVVEGLGEEASAYLDGLEDVFNPMPAELTCVEIAETFYKLIKDKLPKRITLQTI